MNQNDEMSSLERDKEDLLDKKRVIEGEYINQRKFSEESNDYYECKYRRIKELMMSPDVQSNPALQVYYFEMFDKTKKNLMEEYDMQEEIKRSKEKDLSRIDEEINEIEQTLDMSNKDEEGDKENGK